jgi:capsular exopolysaccharide synthesis family protein
MIPPNSNHQPSPDHLPEPYTGATNSGNGVLKPSDIYLSAQRAPGKPGPVGAQQKPGINVLALLHGLRRRWLLAACLAPVVALLVALGSWTWYIMLDNKSHGAVTIMLISPNEQPLIQFSYAPPDTSGAYQRTQAVWIKSRLVINDALKDPKVVAWEATREEPFKPEWLESQLTTDFATGMDFLRLSMAGNDPKEMEILLNAVRDSYFRNVVNKESEARTARVDQLKALARKYEERLRTRRRLLRELAQSIGSSKTEAQAVTQKLAMEQLGQAQQELIGLKSEVRRLQVDLSGQLAKQQAMDDPAVSAELFKNDGTIERQIEEDVVLARLREKKGEAEAKLEELKRLAAPAMYEKLAAPHRNQMMSAEAAMQSRRAELRPILAKQIRDRAQLEVKTEIAQLQARLNKCAQLEKMLDETVEQFSKQTKTLTDRTLEFEYQQEEIANSMTIMKKALSDAEMLEVQLDNASPRVHQLDNVITFPTQQKKRQIITVTGTALLSFFLTLFVVAWWDMRAKRIASVDEVVNSLGLTVIGTLPAWRARSGRRQIGAKSYRDIRWQSMFTESVDATRTMLLHAARKEQLRVVMVTSAVSGEGKTSLSSHLATSIARAGRRTLLLDCDLRNPAAHKLFDLPVGPGFSEVLRGEASLSDVIQPTTINGLWMIPAGQCDERSIQGLTQEEVRDLFAQLKEQFEFVVVDSSPVLPVADSMLVAQYVDAVLFSILRDVSRIPMVYTAYHRLEVLGVRMLGVVVNGANDETQNYGYGYGYGYSYGYGQTPAPDASSTETPTTPG